MRGKWRVGGGVSSQRTAVKSGRRMGAAGESRGYSVASYEACYLAPASSTRESAPCFFVFPPARPRKSF